MTTAARLEDLEQVHLKTQHEESERQLFLIAGSDPDLLDDEEVALLQDDYMRLYFDVANLRKKNLERRKALRALNRAMAASKWQLDCMRQNYLKVANELARVEARSRD